MLQQRPDAQAPRLSSGLSVRPMTLADLPETEPVAAAAFGFAIVGETQARHWRRRLSHLLETDPGGAFVAVREGAIVGVAQAFRRERLWCLSLLTVDPGAQSSGAGRLLMEAALGYGADCEAGLITSSNDPRALRLYASSGFALRPALEAGGVVDRTSIPEWDPSIREGGAADLAALESISRAVRGAPHTTEIEHAFSRGARLLLIPNRGFVVAEEDSGVWLLVAHDEAAATALLWAGLDVAGPAERPIRWITAGQDWAVQVAIRAGLSLRGYGALCVRGDPGPLRPFLPSPPFS